jgi:hypothetical protein
MDAILGYIAALTLSMIATAGFIPWAKMGVTNVQTAAIASQQLIVDKAASLYVQDNAATIAQLATATTPVTITAAMLIAANYLPAGFSATNSYGQTWEAQVLQPTGGELQTLVTSQGGRPISNTQQLVQIAAQSGAQGGFVPYANQAGDASMTPANAYGAYGAWKLALTGYTNPGSGHLASLLAFSGAQANSNYLYRVSVPGQPQLNNMQTDLGLTDTGGTAHNINGVATATANTFQSSGGGQFTADQGGSLELGGNNAQAGTGTPYVDFHQAGQGVQDFNVRVQNDADNHMTISAASGNAGLQVNGTLQLANIASVGTACSPNGIVAAGSDGTGQMFSCLRGTWTPIGGMWVRMGSWVVSNGSTVAEPTCSAGGTPKVEIAAENFYVDTTAAVNMNANEGDGVWTLSIVDGSGTPVSGQAVAQTYCQY